MEECSPARPVSVMHFHGTADDHAAFAGGPGKRSLTGTDFFSVDHSIQAWVKANGCPPEATVTALEDKAEDGTTAERHVYGPGREGAEVVLVKIVDGGHTWPGRPSAARFLGTTCQDISANDLMWEFFLRHPMP
jgi:polyhydroxybutyrate depolymerase